MPNLFPISKQNKRRIDFTMLEPAFYNTSGESLEPSPKGLFEIIERLMHVADMMWHGRINESQWLIHKNYFK